MTQIRIHWSVAMHIAFVFLGMSMFPHAEERRTPIRADDPFYSAEFPEERVAFWTSINRRIVHLQFHEALEELKTIDECSDANGLTLLEFKCFVATKYMCMSAVYDRTIVIEYLDRLVHYTRQSTRWQQEIFVIEYAFSLYYATLGEFEKADDSLSRFKDEVTKKLSEWCSFNTLWDGLTLEHHAACIYASCGKYDEAIDLCEKILNSDLVSSKDAKILDDTFAKLSEVGINRQKFKMLVNDIQSKRAYFKEKEVWSYYCHPSFAITPNENSDGSGEFVGFAMHIAWYQKHGKWTNPPEDGVDWAPYTIRWFVPLPPAILSAEGRAALRAR